MFNVYRRIAAMTAELALVGTFENEAAAFAAAPGNDYQIERDNADGTISVLRAARDPDAIVQEGAADAQH